MIQSRHPSVLMALAAVAVFASGCADTRSVLGLDRSVPDEFVVVSRAPLSLPPDLKLRPPRPGAVGPNETPTVELARQTVFGIENGDGGAGALRLDANTPAAAPVTRVAVMSPGEVALLARVRAGEANADIRDIIDRESAVLARADETFVDRLLNWRGPDVAGTVVDAAAEAKRLRENQALGQPLTEGETPSIRRKRRGLFQGIIN